MAHKPQPLPMLFKLEKMCCDIMTMICAKWHDQSLLGAHLLVAWPLARAVAKMPHHGPQALSHTPPAPSMADLGEMLGEAFGKAAAWVAGCGMHWGMHTCSVTHMLVACVRPASFDRSTRPVVTLLGVLRPVEDSDTLKRPVEASDTLNRPVEASTPFRPVEASVKCTRPVESAGRGPHFH